MANYEKARNMQLKKLKSAAKIRVEQHQEQLRKSFKMKNCLMNSFLQQDKQQK